MNNKNYYHGSDQLFRKFKDDKNGKTSTVFGTEEVLRSGIFFTEDIEVAKNFGNNIYKVNLKIKNQLDLTSGFSEESVLLFKDELNENWMEKVLPEMMWENFDGEDGIYLKNVILKKGYDSVKIKEEVNGELIESTIIFNPEKIKIKSINNKKISNGLKI